MNKTFDNPKEFLETVKIKFSALCISKTWCEKLDVLNDSNYIIIGYKAIRQMREKRQGRGLFIIFNESLTCKISNHLNDSPDAIECLCIEIDNKISKNVFLILGYRPPSDSNLFEKHLKYALSKIIK